jgi:hypothetical protein
MLYTPHIGKPLTRERLEALFEWKNQMRFSDSKRRSLEAHYFRRAGKLETVPRSTDPQTFLAMCGTVTRRAIWGIFLLHCWSPSRYPIYDQHVHRAMTFLQGQRREELGAWTDANKISAYLDRYVGFYHGFGAPDVRMLDRALWELGRFIKHAHLPDLLAQGYGSPDGGALQACQR